MELQGRAGKWDQECLHWSQQGWGRGPEPLMENVRSFSARDTPHHPECPRLFSSFAKHLSRSIYKFNEKSAARWNWEFLGKVSAAAMSVWPEDKGKCRYSAEHKEPLGWNCPCLTMLDHPPDLPHGLAGIYHQALQVTLNGARLLAHNMLWALTSILVEATW